MNTRVIRPSWALAQIVINASWIVLGLGMLSGLALPSNLGSNPLAVRVAWAQETTSAQADALYFARWNINYGEYLIDVGKYLEALEAFQTALEAAPTPQVRAEAALQRASTFSIFLDSYDDAQREYEGILREMSQGQQAETARYRLALLLFDQQRYNDAMGQLEAYLKQFPKGRFTRSVEFLLARSQQAVSSRPPSKPATPPALSPAPAPAPQTAARPQPGAPAEPSLTPVPSPIPVPSPHVADDQRSPVPAPPPSLLPKPGPSPELTPAPELADGGQEITPPTPTPSLSPAPTPVPTPAPTVQASERPRIRVRLIKKTTRVDIQSKGTITATSVTGQQLFNSTAPLTLTLAKGVMTIGSSNQTARELRISATKPLSISQKKLRCGGRKSPELPARYRGQLRVFVHGGKLRVVNELDIEEYLQGVVPAEVPASWPLEALKTQAIAARTYALYQMEHRRKWSYDLVDSDGDQVYKGLRCEAKRSAQAVSETQGMVIMYKQRPILAMYSANTGYHSASVQHIFSQKLSYLVGVSDPYSPTQPLGNWSRTHSEAEIRQKLAEIGLRFDSIQELRPVDVTPSGRVKKIEVVHPKGTRVIRAWTTLRRVLKLPEVLIKITQKDRQFTFEGSGFGHGVGYSQWGAKAMAAKGQSAKNILNFYYRNVDFKRMW